MCNECEGENFDAWRFEVYADIERYGWMIQAVIGDEPALTWAYTIGLAGGLGHPELVVVGLGMNATGRLLNGIGEQIREGRRFNNGDVLVGSGDDVVWLSEVDRGNFETGVLGMCGAITELSARTIPRKERLRWFFRDDIPRFRQRWSSQRKEGCQLS